MLKDGLHQQLSSAREFFNRSTRNLVEADSSFAPQPELFTVAQQVAHAAQTIEWFVDGAFAPEGFSMDFEGMDKAIRTVTSLTAAREWFERACAHATDVINAHSQEEWMAPLPPGPIMGGDPRFVVFGALTDHSAHHRGVLTVYTRLLGKVPPMPYMEM